MIVGSQQTAYVVINSDGKVIDKDGHDPVPFEMLSLEHVEDYMY